MPYEAERLINLHIVNSTGVRITICLPLTLTGVDVKKKAIRMFCHEQFHNCDVKIVNDISQQFKLLRISDLHGHYDETTSLAAAHVQNDEEMLLTQRYIHTNNSKSCLPANRSPSLYGGNRLRYNVCCDSDESDESLTGPTQENIEMATGDVDAKHFAAPAIVNIDELVLQSDVSYNITAA